MWSFLPPRLMMFSQLRLIPPSPLLEIRGSWCTGWPRPAPPPAPSLQPPPPYILWSALQVDSPCLLVVKNIYLFLFWPINTRSLYQIYLYDTLMRPIIVNNIWKTQTPCPPLYGRNQTFAELVFLTTSIVVLLWHFVQLPYATVLPRVYFLRYRKGYSIIWTKIFFYIVQIQISKFPRLP